MKKKTIIRSIIALALALATVFAVSAIAAEYDAGDGMTFEIVTSKKEYGVNEEIQILLLAKNYNGRMKLANFAWDAEVPSDLTLMSGELEGAQVIEVGERAVVALKAMKVVQMQEELPPATQPTEPTTDAPNEKQGPSAGTVVVLVLLILLGLAGIGGIVYLILKRRGVISCIALLLSLGMLLPCIPAVDVSAVELNPGEILMGDNNTLSASVKFIVDGKEYEATATATYEMADQTETVVEAMHSSMSKLKWDKYNAPVVTPTVGEHPRFMFTQEDVPGIIKTLEAPECAAFAAEFYRLLAISFNGSFGAPKVTIDANGNTVVNANFSEDKINSIRIKALYYALYKNSEDAEEAHMATYYGEQAVRAIQKALETVTFKPDEDDIYHRGDVQCAAAEVYDWCYDLLTHEEKQKIAAGAIKIGGASEAGWPIKIGGPGDSVLGHWGGNLIQTYWMAVAIAMCDEYPTFFEYIGGAYFQSYVDIRNAWNVAESNHQGMSYGAGGRHDADMTAQYMIYAMTGGDNDRDGDGNQDGYISLSPNAAAVSYSIVYGLRPDGQFLREGDTWEESNTNKFELWDANAVHLERASNFYKDGVLRRLAMELDNFNYTGMDFLYLLVTHDTEVQTKRYSDLPYTKFFPTPAGNMIARTGWDTGTASNDVIAKMQITQVYNSPHQHHDAGNFQIYYKGILASESGYYTTINDPHYTGYHTTSIAHNTLAITSLMNRYGKQTDPANPDWGVEGNTPITNKLVGHEFGPNIYKPEYSYLAGDIAGSYDDNVQEAVRSMLFLNLELDGNSKYPGAFVVFDQIKTNQVNTRKSFMLHMQSEPEVDGNTIIIKNTKDAYDGMLTDQVLYVGTASKVDPSYTINKIGGPGKEFMVGNYNYAHSGSVSGSICQERGWGRVEITTSTTEENQTDYMLNVMYVSDAEDEPQIVPAKLIYDGKGVIMGAQLMNHVAMFNMDGNNRISKEVSFTIPKNDGYSTFKVNVAGLKAGTWTVYVNGKSVGTQIASEDGGMIYFEAAAGTVKLVYTDANANKTFDETPITEEEPIGLMVNNYYYYTDTPPVKSGEDYLIPVSVIMEALNGKGKWNADRTKYTVEYMSAVYEFTANSITKAGQPVEFNEIKAVAGDLLVDMTTLKSAVLDGGAIYYDSFINKIRVNVQAQVSIPAIPEDVLFKYPTAVQVEALIDNGYSTLPLLNMLDGDPTTYWTSQKSGNNICDAVFDFGKVVPLTDIMIMFHTESSLYSDFIFDILVSVDGVNWTTVYEKAHSGEINPRTYMYSYVNLPMSDEARYVRIIGHGRHRYTNSGKPNPTADNGWTVISEIIFLQKSIIDPNGAEIIGNKLLAEAECFNKQDTVLTERNNLASGKEEVVMKVGYTTNPGSVTASKPQLCATFIPKKTANYYIWAKVNTSKVTSGDCIWVNIEGVTGNTYYAEKLNAGKKDKDGYEWIKLGQYEDQAVGAQWKADEKYDLSVISGCNGLVIDCFIVTPDASYVPYDACYSKKTNTNGEVTVNGKDTIYEHSMAKPSGTAAKLQSVSADGNVSQAYIDYVLKTENMPGDLSLNIITNTSGRFSVWATVKAASASADKFFYAVSANDDDFKYTLGDLSEMTTVAEGGYVKVKLGELEIQASESIYVRIKTCSKGMTFDTFSTTCVLPEGVISMSGGKVTVQAEDTKLQKPGEETIIVDAVTYDRYYQGEVAKVVDSTGAVGGKAVQFMKTNTGYNALMYATNEATPHLSFRVMPDQSGEYYIWIKVYAPQNTGVYAWIDGGDDYYYWRQPLNWETFSADSEDYIWVRLYQESRNGTKLTREHLYNWTARRIYTINLRGMYSGVKVDEIFITKNPADAPHNHSYSSTWSGNDTHHWYDLTCGCQNVSPRYYAEHFFEDHTDKECNTCGYKNPNYSPHNYADGKCTICGGLAPFSTSGGKLTLEAENLMLAPDDRENHIPGYLKKPVIKVVDQESASGGKAAQFLKTNSGWNAFTDQGTTPIPHLSALVTPDKSGQYYIWLKVYAPANASYGAYIYAYVDGGSDTCYWRQPLALNGYSKGEGDYFWVCLNQEWRSNTQKFADHTYKWTAGQTYALRFRGTVVGVQIDQIYITNSASDVPHNHTWNSLKSYDDTYHWWTSSCHAGVITGKAKHNYDNLKDTTCNDCNYIRPAHVCTFSERWSVNSTQHWHACACGDKADVGNHNFVDSYCTVCNMAEPVKLTNGKGTLQGENATLAEAGTENVIADYPDAPATVKNNTAASAGKTLRFNKNHSAWNTLRDWDPAVHNGQEPIAHATFNVTADTTGDYYIWLKVCDDDLNSSHDPAVFCQIDGVNAEGEATDTYYWRQPLKQADGTYPTDKSFYWVRVYQEFYQDNYEQNGADKVYHWEAGETYALRFRGRAAGVQIDEIYITNDPNDAPHNHSFSAEWEKDETHHWHKANCGHDELISGKAEHSFETVLDTTCSDCGYERPAHVHNYSTEWRVSLTHHWHECACGARQDEAQHTFVDRVCTGCGMYEPFLTSGGKVAIEAEKGVLAAAGTENVIANYPDAPATVKDNTAASAGKTLRFNKNHSAWNTLRDWDPAVHNGQEPIAHATFNVTADTTGDYYIWLKVCDDDLNTSHTPAVFCQIDGVNAEGEATDTYYWRQPLKQADGTYPTDKSFYWVRVYQEFQQDNYAQNGADKVYHWEAGKTYTLRFRGRAAGVQIDEIYITTDLNDPYVKNHEHTFATQWSKDDTHHWHAATCGHAEVVSGRGAHVFTDAADTTCNTCGAERHVHVYTNGVCACGASEPISTQGGTVVIEAENTVLNGTNGVIVEKADASNGKVVNAATRNPVGNALTEDTQGDIELTVRPDVTGTYYIWVRVTTNSASKGAGTWVDGVGYTYQQIGLSTETSSYIWKKFTATPTWEAGQEYKIKLGIWSYGSTVNYDQFIITTSDKTPAEILASQG